VEVGVTTVEKPAFLGADGDPAVAAGVADEGDEGQVQAEDRPDRAEPGAAACSGR
jgi:hypothetical protein